jgi:hypothetical protein
MAKKKPARAKAAKAAKKSNRARAAKAVKSAARRAKSAKRGAKKVARKASKVVGARKAAAKKTGRKTVRRVAKKARKVATKTAVRRVAAKRTVAKPRKAPAARPRVQAELPLPPAITATATTARAAKPRKASTPRPKRAPTLDRARKTVGLEAEPHGLPSSLDLERGASSVRSGRKEMADRLKQHTSTGPAITAGDVDANWEDAETVGDEAPGGDNPTPDQDVVDDIGRALGVEYDDDEELKGGDEIASRDKHRWELDPASSDDFKDRD